MKRTYSVIAAAIAVVCACLFQGCASTAGQVCPLDPLMNPEIRFNDNGNANVIDDHIYFSKEGSSGGRGFGGGCGCN
jgi:hypothetical protein